jgi:hypothetical protein
LIGVEDQTVSRRADGPGAIAPGPPSFELLSPSPMSAELGVSPN